MNKKHIIAHMKVAHIYAELSYCKKKKVGCVIVKENTPIAVGYNGTPTGENNTCEDDTGKTKPNVVHAEDNALRKLMLSHESSKGAIVFITAAPCQRCAEKLADARVAKVYYSELYISGSSGLGLEYLHRHGIETELLEI